MLIAGKIIIVEGLIGGGLTLLWGVVGNFHYTDTINAGAILVGAMVMIVAGFFTARSKSIATWRNAWEGEKVLREEREGEIGRLKEQIVQEREQQQVLRHELKNQLAEKDSLIKLLEIKTDLSGHEDAAIGRHAQLIEMISTQTTVMTRIADALEKYSAPQSP